MYHLFRKGVWEIAVLLLILVVVVLAFTRSENVRIREEASAVEIDNYTKAEQEVESKRMREEARSYINSLTKPERNKLLFGAVQASLSKRFEVFADTYSISRSKSHNQEAYSRLRIGVTNVLAAAWLVTEAYKINKDE